MKPLRLMDLDLLVLNGMKARPFYFKSGGNEVNLSAVQYAIERIACFINQGMSICVVKQFPFNENEIKSCRDPLSRLCYEILSDKLETMGICVKTFESRAELEDYVYDVVNRGYRGKNPFPTIRAIIDCPKLYTIIDNSYSICIDSDVSINAETYNACDDEIDVPLIGYPLIYVLKKYVNDKYIELFDEYKSLGYTPKEMAIPIKMGEFIQSKCADGTIPVSVGRECLVELLNMNDVSEELDKEEFKSFNYDGSVTLLTGFGLKTALEVLGVYEQNYTKQTNLIRSYLKSKVDSYCSGQYSLDNGISLQTDYFSDTSETIVDKNGEVVRTDRNDEFLSEEELINEFT